ncbi:hemagglutinin repeat-containing protein [Orbus sturtevantii]|uniref:hemagglutinin repeat-containing protein n=1 Tax=Orbus sturtevantii TaxID=3074109 RepID=UPI00370D1062
MPSTTSDTQRGYQSSTVGSTEGNVTIKAGQNLTVKGSDIIAKKEINLTGNNVTLEENGTKVTYKASVIVGGVKFRIYVDKLTGTVRNFHSE